MKTSVYIATSLDGFIARENGDLDWLPGSDGSESESSDEDYGFRTFMDSVDVLVMGRNTYEKVLSFGQWPYGSKRVVILSSKLTQVADNLPKTVEVRSASPIELVKALRESRAGHIYIDGGKTIQGFLNAGLIEEIIITRIPILIGRGIPLFGPLNKDLQLEHIETRSFANGFVQSKYRVCE
jgi:dihydrofolate reductase